MGIRVALRHSTAYHYDRAVTLQPQVVRLRPAPHCRTTIHAYALHVQPQPHFLNWQQDPYGNYLARLVFPQATDTFTVDVELLAELTPINPFDFFVESGALHYPFRYEPPLARELAPYLETLPPTALLQDFVRNHLRSDRRTVDFLVELNQHLRQRVDYVIRLEPGVQSPEETLRLGRGSCRDSAWLLAQLCRNLGLAARFVSGYLIQLAADEKPLEGPTGPTSDFTDLHAWTEVYVPGAGWIGLDPTSGLLAAEGHIPLACTAEPQSAAPIAGTFTFTPRQPGDQVSERFTFQMCVERLIESPRVTLPYSEEQWEAIQACGRAVDQRLASGDVRLTMGGEPTFVSVDDRDGAEWNTDALGPTKRKLADDLLRRLRARFAPGGLLHYGQGKWYPGESLPRWALSCYWRRDGEPIWRDLDLIADERHDYGFESPAALRFLRHLVELLAVSDEGIQPAYEDVWYYLWRERRLPVNVDPLDCRLDDPEERARLARVFEQGLNQVAGYALPLRRNHASETPRWETGAWLLRREHLFLIPGDSPMGFRLPLDSLPWETPETRDRIHELDPLEPRPALRPHAQLMPRAQQPRPAGDSRWPWLRGPAPESATMPVVRTALCVEPRLGRLHVFMPPLRFLDDYLELVAAIEETARELRMPVAIEGYQPPYDPRINHLAITPDPGVVEVNLHPAHSWEELVANTTILYEEARQARLTAEKFQLDGRHTGTGGGNHIVLGGPTPADSPWLRRPHLLRSLVGFWNNHPALSYLFSGLFVGPTSQHPRLDEARHEALREFELAGQVLPAGQPLPWIVDRVFRHLLVDATGNTHRAEFCIDKLYSPESPDGRRGLLELRAFEMPPHSRMSCVQQLLLRALVARFWDDPYSQPLVRWGTELHDRYLLPHFVEQDLQDVLTELKQSGIDLDPSWFAPHVEFRFPVLGSIIQRGVEVELRQAIEPWPVLGEEGGSSGTVRYVDSSVERLQVKVRGWIEPRHVVTCNGRPVPLRPTGTRGEAVAGVRYRAWQPPACLHPTIGVHTPLIFDLYDTWNQRSIGGCTYHVSHPGGRAYDVFPVNAREAESRRLARFFPFGHRPGIAPLPPATRLPEFPWTLDLRQPE